MVRGGISQNPPRLGAAGADGRATMGPAGTDTAAQECFFANKMGPNMKKRVNYLSKSVDQNDLAFVRNIAYISFCIIRKLPAVNFF